MTPDKTLYEQTDQRFKYLVGKKVKFICKGEVCIGILDFAGINDTLHGKFQVTASRTPHWPVDPNTIKEVTGTTIRAVK
jgi:hypothetical protein